MFHVFTSTQSQKPIRSDKSLSSWSKDTKVNKVITRKQVPLGNCLSNDSWDTTVDAQESVGVNVSVWEDWVPNVLTHQLMSPSLPSESMLQPHWFMSSLIQPYVPVSVFKPSSHSYSLPEVTSSRYRGRLVRCHNVNTVLVCYEATLLYKPLHLLVFVEVERSSGCSLTELWGWPVLYNHWGVCKYTMQAFSTNNTHLTAISKHQWQ